MSGWDELEALEPSVPGAKKDSKEEPEATEDKEPEKKTDDRRLAGLAERFAELEETIKELRVELTQVKAELASYKPAGVPEWVYRPNPYPTTKDAWEIAVSDKTTLKWDSEQLNAIVGAHSTSSKDPFVEQKLTSRIPPKVWEAMPLGTQAIYEPALTTVVKPEVKVKKVGK